MNEYRTDFRKGKKWYYQGKTVPQRGGCSPKPHDVGLQVMQVAVPTTGPLPRGNIQPCSHGSHRAADSPTHPLHPPLGGGTAGGEAQPLSSLGSRTETSPQEDRRCDSLTSLPPLWSLQMSPSPGKSNWEMFDKPSYLNPSCLRQDQALTTFGEHVLSKHGARSLAKDTNTVQDKQSHSDILYDTHLSLKRIV